MVRRSLNQPNTDTSSESQELKGSWVNDPVYSLLEGYSRRIELVNHVHLLYGEIQAILDHLFPYSLGDRDALKFTLQYDSDEDVRYTLHQHLIEDEAIPRKWERDRLYPTLGLKGLLDEIAAMLLRDGEVFYAIDWEPLSNENGSLIVPLKFRYLRSSTMHRVTDSNKETFIQKYNPLIEPNYPDLIGRTFTFDSEEILHIQYVLGQPPVQLAEGLALESWAIRQEQMLTLEASTYPEDMRIQLERARYLSNKQLWREYYLARARIRKMFSLPFEDIYRSSGSLEVSEPYKAHRLVEHLRYMANFRKFLLDQINEQVMTRIAKRNNLPEIPLIQFKGNHATEDEIQRSYAAYQVGTMTSEELKESLTNR